MICQMIAALVLCETSLLEDPKISGPKGDEGVHAKRMWMVGLTTESLEGKPRNTSILIYRKHMVSAYFSFKPSSNRDIFRSTGLMKKQPETMGEIMFVTGKSTTGKLQTGSMFVILFASFGYLMLFKYDFQGL